MLYLLILLETEGAVEVELERGHVDTPSCEYILLLFSLPYWLALTVSQVPDLWKPLSTSFSWQGLKVARRKGLRGAQLGLVEDQMQKLSDLLGCGQGLACPSLPLLCGW